jgi:hypothetical protein
MHVSMIAGGTGITPCDQVRHPDEPGPTETNGVQFVLIRMQKRHFLLFRMQSRVDFRSSKPPLFRIIFGHTSKSYSFASHPFYNVRALKEVGATEALIAEGSRIQCVLFRNAE